MNLDKLTTIEEINELGLNVSSETAENACLALFAAHQVKQDPFSAVVNFFIDEECTGTDLDEDIRRWTKRMIATLKEELDIHNNRASMFQRGLF